MPYRDSTRLFPLVLRVALLFLPLQASLVLSNGLPAGSATQPVSVFRASGEALPPACSDFSLAFAVIGDFGYAGDDELAVAELVKSWQTDFIITTGDNNYPAGAAATIDANIGQYYAEYIGNYIGGYGSGPDPDRPTNFYPTLGNHDWYTRSGDPPLPQAHLDYFTLPGNERYYQFVRGPAAFFAMDSDVNEPDGITSSSAQGEWLRAQLAASDAPWKLVYMHHPPFSSSAIHGSTPALQWPYSEWGATAVLAGHDHTYERIILDDFPYFVNGLGGRSRYILGLPIAGSQVRYSSAYGAMRVQVNQACILFEFINVSGTLVDAYYQIRYRYYLPTLFSAP